MEDKSPLFIVAVSNANGTLRIHGFNEQNEMTARKVNPCDLSIEDKASVKSYLKWIHSQEQTVKQILNPEDNK